MFLSQKKTFWQQSILILEFKEYLNIKADVQNIKMDPFGFLTGS